MTKKRSLLTWLLLVPFRRGIRWLTLVGVLLAALAAWTGYLGHGARYVFWRLWPLDTPLLEYVDPALPRFVLVDASRPGARELAPLREIPWVKKRVQLLQDRLAIDPRFDLLQILVTVDSQGRELSVYRGRFVASAIRSQLGKMGFQAQAQEQQTLFLRDRPAEAWLLDGAVLIHGPPDAVRRAQRRARQGSGLRQDPRFETLCARIGRRHGILALSLGERSSGSDDLDRRNEARLESASLTVDPSDAGQLQLDLALTPLRQDQVKPLEQQLRGAVGLLQGGATLALPQSVASVVRDVRVDAGDDSVHARLDTPATQLASAIGDVAQPGNALRLGVAAALGVAGGSWLHRLGLRAPGSHPGAAPTTPPSQPDEAAAPSGLGAWLKGLKQHFQGSRAGTPSPAAGASGPASP